MRPKLKRAAPAIATAAAYLLGLAMVVGTGWSLWRKTQAPSTAMTPPARPKAALATPAAAPPPVLEPFQLAGEITIIGPGGTTNAFAPPTVLDLNAPLQTFTLENAPQPGAPEQGPRIYTTGPAGSASSSADFVAPHYYSFDDHIIEAVTRLNRGEAGNPKWAKRTIVRPFD